MLLDYYSCMKRGKRKNLCIQVAEFGQSLCFPILIQPNKQTRTAFGEYRSDTTIKIEGSYPVAAKYYVHIKKVCVWTSLMHVHERVRVCGMLCVHTSVRVRLHCAYGIECIECVYH